MKKIFCVFLTMIMLLNVLFVPIKAEDYSGTCGDDLTWTLSGGTLTISGSGNMYNYNYDKGVYAPWYNYANSIKKIVIEDGCTYIGHSAFYHLYWASKLIVPASVTGFSQYALSNCNALTSVGPAGSGASYEYSWTDSIPGLAFSGLYGVKTITIAEGITSIGGACANWCTALTQVNLPSTLESIGDGAFYKCSSLNKINIPRSVTYIGGGAFSSCGSKMTAKIECGSSLTADQLSKASLSSYSFEKHSLSKVESKEATCEKNGNIEYWKCSKCGNIYGNEQGTNQLSLSDTVISKIGHNYKSSVTKPATCLEDGIMTYTCQNDSSHTYTETIEKIGHNYKSSVTKNPTCTSKGITTFICQNDSSHTYTEDIENFGHSLKHFARKDATKDKEGNIEYWYCERCKKYFSDEACTREILLEDTILEKSNYVSKITKEPTCTKTGTRQYTNVNDEEDIYEEEIAPLGHLLKHFPRVDATKDSEGNIEYWYCERCHKYFADRSCKKEIRLEDIVLKTTEKNYTSHIIVNPTCEEKGIRIFINIDDSNDYYEEEIDELGHNLVHIGSKKSTFKEEGNIEYWYCDECNNYFKDSDGNIKISIEDTIIEKRSVIPYVIGGIVLFGVSIFLIFIYKKKKKNNNTK